MKYSEQLQSPKWQRKRLEIMQRDNFTCVECGYDDRQLQVHHIEYKKGKQAWEYDDSNFKTLCDICHYYHHAEPYKFNTKQL